jgi:hypothetical protein
MMSLIYTWLAKNFNHTVAEPFTFTFRGIGNEIGVFVDYCCALMTDITLAFMVCSVKNFSFSIIGKCSDYSYHTDTSKIIAVMIDANYRLAYPLGQKLEGKYGNRQRFRRSVVHNGD